MAVILKEVYCPNVDYNTNNAIMNHFAVTLVTRHYFRTFLF